MAIKRNIPRKVSGLVGLFFHTFGADGTIDCQGEIIAQVSDENFLVQYFDWFTGSESTLAVIPISTMVCLPKDHRKPFSWQFYRDEEHMRNWYSTWGKKYCQD